MKKFDITVPEDIIFIKPSHESIQQKCDRINTNYHKRLHIPIINSVDQSGAIYYVTQCGIMKGKPFIVIDNETFILPCVNIYMYWVNSMIEYVRSGIISMPINIEIGRWNKTNGGRYWINTL